MTTIVCVAPHLLRDVWPFVERFIDAAYEAVGRVTPDVLTWLEEGHGLLWVVSDGERIVAAATTSIEARRSGKICRVGGCGGVGMDTWLQHLGAIEDYARGEGCFKVEVEGRKGWVRALHGYQVQHVSLEKRL